MLAPILDEITAHVGHAPRKGRAMSLPGITVCTQGSHSKGKGQNPAASGGKEASETPTVPSEDTSVKKSAQYILGQGTRTDTTQIGREGKGKPDSDSPELRSFKSFTQLSHIDTRPEIAQAIPHGNAYRFPAVKDSQGTSDEAVADASSCVRKSSAFFMASCFPTSNILSPGER